MHIGVIGAGSLGTLISGYLSDAGHEVHILEIRAEVVSHINEEGVTIERSDESPITAFPTATSNPEEVPELDIVFVFVKAHHTRQAIRDAAPMIREETTVVTVQNGLKNIEIINEEYPNNDVIGGVIYIGSQELAPGRVLQTKKTGITIGGDNSASLDEVATALRDGNIPVTITEDPNQVIWEKQLATVGTKAVAALTGLNDGPIAECPETADLMELLIREATEVAEAIGITVTWDPVEDAYEICETYYDTKPSMLQDVENERPTEIDHINGAIVEFGEEHDINTPYNKTITSLVKGKEYGYLHESVDS
jgi:2-dehydropantoate 2-reductase